MNDTERPQASEAAFGGKSTKQSHREINTALYATVGRLLKTLALVIITLISITDIRPTLSL